MLLFKGKRKCYSFREISINRMLSFENKLKGKMVILILKSEVNVSKKSKSFLKWNSAIFRGVLQLCLSLDQLLASLSHWIIATLCDYWKEIVSGYFQKSMFFSASEQMPNLFFENKNWWIYKRFVLLEIVCIFCFL